MRSTTARASCWWVVMLLITRCRSGTMASSRCGRVFPGPPVRRRTALPMSTLLHSSILPSMQQEPPQDRPGWRVRSQLSEGLPPSGRKLQPLHGDPRPGRGLLLNRQQFQASLVRFHHSQGFALRLQRGPVMSDGDMMLDVSDEGLRGGLGVLRKEGVADGGEQLLEEEAHAGVDGVVANDHPVAGPQEDPSDDGQVPLFQLVLRN